MRNNVKIIKNMRKIRMNDFDRAILSCLKSDGRMSYQEISTKIGLSISSVARRVQAMEANGIIEGYTVKVNDEKIGYGFSVFVSVKLEKQLASNFALFEQKVKRFPEVVECWLMTGAQDYLLKLSTADVRDFERFLTEELTAIDKVSSVDTSIPLRCVKANEYRLKR